jgi:hypothetical protein
MFSLLRVLTVPGGFARGVPRGAKPFFLMLFNNAKQSPYCESTPSICDLV